MGLNVIKIDENNIGLWNQYVNNRDDTSFVDTFEWRTVIEKAYGLRNFWFIAENNGIVEGSMALTLANHSLFGKYLATAPFGSMGGFYYDTKEARELLIKKAEELNESLGSKYILIRKYDNGISPPDGWQNHQIYSSYIVHIPNDISEYYKHTLSRKTRACIRNSKKYGVYVSFGHKELLDDFWYVILRAMKELGSPYHSRYFLESILKIFDTKAQINILYTKNNIPCAAGLSIIHNNKVEWLFGPNLKTYKSLNIGEHLYWSIIDEYFNKGFQVINLGRSLDGSGNEQFKLKWRPVVYDIANWYYLAKRDKIPNLNQSNPKLQTGILIWSHMPIWFHKLLGPRIISGIL